MNFSFVTVSCKFYPQNYVTSETHTLLPPVILCHLLQVSVSQHIASDAMFSSWFQVSYANYMVIGFMQLAKYLRKPIFCKDPTIPT